MLRLLESGVRPAPRTGWTFASAFAHGSIIAMAVLATLQTQRPTASSEPLTRLLYVAAPLLPARPGTGGSGAAAPADVPRLALPSISLPNIVGVDLDLTPRIGAILPGPGGGAGIDATEGGFTGDGIGLARTDVHLESQVDHAVVAARNNPRPDYPASLRGAGLSGDVIVRFVVDTTGRVEPGSIDVQSATHELFADAVRRWLLRTHYAPAEFRGQRVRQLVQQRVAFELTR